MGAWVHRLTNIDPEKRTGDCAACGPAVRIKRKVKKGQVRYCCYTADRQHRGPGRNGRARQLLGPAGYQVMLEAQGGRCAICGDLMDPPHADHCHVEDRARGLLCRTCNLGLGYFRDRPDLLDAAKAYLTTPG